LFSAAVSIILLPFQLTRCGLSPFPAEPRHRNRARHFRLPRFGFEIGDPILEATQGPEFPRFVLPPCVHFWQIRREV
jgi:hypothetical protein